MTDLNPELIRLYKIVRNANVVKAEIAYKQAKRWMEAFKDTSRIKP